MIDICQWRMSIGLWRYSCQLLRRSSTGTSSATREGQSARASLENMSLTLSIVVVSLSLLLIMSGNVETNPGPKTATSDMCKVLKDVLTENFSVLTDAMKNCLPRTAELMYSKKLISTSARDSNDSWKMIGEFESKMNLKDKVSDLENHCQLFLDCLSCQSGPLLEAAQRLSNQWKEQVQQQLNILLSLHVIAYPSNVLIQENSDEDISSGADGDIQTTSQNGVSDDVAVLNKSFVLSADNEEEIKKKLIYLDEKYKYLLKELEKEFKIDERVIFPEVIKYIERSIKYDDELRRKLQNCKTIDDLIAYIDDSFDFLDCRVTANVAKHFASPDLASKFDTYSNETEQLRSSSSVKILKNKLHQVFRPHMDNPENAPTAHIDLQSAWDDVTIDGLTILMKRFFPKDDRLSFLQKIKITASSVHIEYCISESPDEIHQIIEHCRQNTSFMRYIGIYKFEVNGVIVLDEDKDDSYTLEYGLLKAAADGNIESVNFLIDLGVNINCSTQEGQTAMVKKSDNIYHIMMVANRNEQVELTRGAGFTSLMLASHNGHSEAVELLLKHKADYNIHNNNGFTSLMLASYNGHSEVVELLLKHKANHNIRKNDGFTSLMLASYYGHSEVVELLLKHKADHNIRKNDGFTSLMLASQNGHSEVVELLLKHEADPNIQNNDGFTSLMLASQNGHSETVELLLKHKVDPNIQNNFGSTSLMFASHNGHFEVVKLLINHKANSNVQNNNRATSLIIMCTCSPEYMTLYKKDNDDIIQRLNLHRIPILELLLDANASPIVTLSDGRELSSLAVAAFYNNLDAVNVLMGRVEFSNELITHALIAACYVGNPSVINALSHKITNLPYKELLLSCAEGDIAGVFSAIYESNVNPDTPLVCGLTPLMVASSCGHIELMDALIQAGADINLPNDNGHTPLDIVDHEYIIRPPNQDVISILVEHGAIHMNPVDNSKLLYYVNQPTDDLSSSTYELTPGVTFLSRLVEEYSPISYLKPKHQDITEGEKLYDTDYTTVRTYNI